MIYRKLLLSFVAKKTGLNFFYFKMCQNVQSTSTASFAFNLCQKFDHDAVHE